MRESDDRQSLTQKNIRWKWIIPAMILLLLVVFAVIFVRIRRSEVLNFSSNAETYEYDPDNILGIKATVIDGRNYTYIFDGDLCFFKGYSVMRENLTDKIRSCSHNIPNVSPQSVILNRRHGDIYLTLCFGDDVDMERVDGFYLYLSEMEWITVNQPTNTIFLNHYEITGEDYANAGYKTIHGHDWSQIWNKDGSGKWSEVQDKGYYWSDMPLE